MTSEFQDDMINNGWPMVMDSLRADVIYTPKGQSAVTRNGPFYETEGIVSDEEPGVVTHRSATLKLNPELDGFSLTPQVDDTVTKDGDIWQYKGHFTNNGIHTINLIIAIVSEYDSGAEFSS